MRAVRLAIVILILLVTVPSYGGVSDPHEIVEQSHVDNVTSRSVAPVDPTWRAVGTQLNNVAEGVTATIKNFWNKGVETLTGQKPVVKPQTPSTAAQAAPTPAVAPTPSAPAPEVQAWANEVVTLSGTAAGSVRELKDARKQLALGAAKVTVEGRKPGKGLKLNKLGVPVFPMEVKRVVKLKGGKTKVVMAPMTKIPRLDVGQEPTLSSNDFVLETLNSAPIMVQDIPALPSPALVSDLLVKAATNRLVNRAEGPKDVDKTLAGVDQIVTREEIQKAAPTLKTLAKIEEKPFRELTKPELQMLTALILYGKGNRCHVLLGLLDELSQNEKFASEANFHLGQCAYRLKMTTLGFERLASLIVAESRDFAADSIRTLAKDLPLEYEVRFSKLIRNLKNTKLIPDDLKDEVHYLTAKGAIKEGDFQSGRQFAERIPETSPRFANAQYLVGVAWYGLGNMTRAVDKFEGLRQWLQSKRIVDKNLNSLTAINLARMKFQQGKFQEALPLYMAIDKDHPTWVQGLVEQGWTQLALDDFSGAIGNMYSLHSPYFRAVYKPESFVVRTIGYLNICQYGDAYRTLSWLEYEYRPWLGQIDAYVASKKLASDYYETVRNYLRGKSDQNVDGLPHQVIREMARQREFLNYQTALNNRADEDVHYEGVEKVIAEERASLKARIKKATVRFQDVKAKLKKAETDRSLAQQVDLWKKQMRLERELVIGLRYQSDVLEASRKAYQPLKAASLARLERERYNLRESAGRHLVTTLARIRSEVGSVLENNEFLRYEVFAGSGENLRYQVAGGKVAGANRLPASVKPAKLMSWSFDGEYWEDEIGSYRSSLANNCPQIGKMEEFFKNKDGRANEGEQGHAALEKGVGQ